MAFAASSGPLVFVPAHGGQLHTCGPWRLLTGVRGFLKYPSGPLGAHEGEGRAPLGVISSPMSLRQIAASSSVLSVLAGWTLLFRPLGTCLGSSTVPLGELSASLVDESAAAE